MAVSLSLLRLRLVLMRFGWAHAIIAALALVAASIWLVAIPDADGRLAEARQALTQARAMRGNGIAISSPRVLNDERMEQFYQVLGERSDAEEQIAALFALADKFGLVLPQADYKLSHHEAGKFSTYHIVLPLKGSFAAIQRFSEEALLTLPNAALDQLSLRRDGIDKGVVEAQLSFTLYLVAPSAGNGKMDGSAEE